MKKRYLLLLVIVQLSCTSEKNTKLNAQVNNTSYADFIYKECENPDIIEVEHAEDGYIEVEYFCDGVRYEMGIKDDLMLFIETSVKLSDIPYDKIKNKLEKNYKKWFVDEAALVKTTDTSFYKLEVIKDGIEQNLYFTKDGKWFKFNSLEISDKWDLRPYEKVNSFLKSGYNFFEPNEIYEMPDLLREISGISIKNATTIYCVQDELGAIFEFDLTKSDITQLLRFSDIGDFEDIALLNDKLYILRSDGLLFPYDLNKKQTLATTMMPLNSLDIEGLSTWKDTIYVASKTPQVNQDNHKRSIFKLEEQNLNKPKLYLEIDIEDIITLVSKSYKGINASSIQFNPSALAFHPITEELYVLSASDRLIAVYKNKKLSNAILLPSNTYYKPEGLSFTENGDLYISSEGDKKGFIKGSIMFFKYQL